MKNVTLFILIILGFVLGPVSAYSQSKFGNEWINPAKIYCKIKVAQNGIYKVTYEELKSVGFVSEPIESSSLKLINFGNEEALHLSDTKFGPGTYLEFYGAKNTIGLDTFLYSDWKKDLFNPEYSLVNDTNAYFLTISSETFNLRYTQVKPDYNNVTLAPFPYYLHEEKVVFNNVFYKNIDGEIRYSNFEPSEGFGSGILQTSNTVLNTSQYIESGPSPALKFRTGQNNQLSRLEISWNNQLKETLFINPKLTSQFEYNIDKSDIKSANTLGLKNTNSAFDRHIIAYASLTYPRAFDFGNKSDYAFLLPASDTKRLLEISSFKTENQPTVLYDITSKIRYNTNSANGKLQVIVNSSESEVAYQVVNDGSGKQKVASLTLFTPKKFENKGQQFVFITNKQLHNQGTDYVAEYAAYRSSKEGGDYKTEIVDIEDIYDHFGFGIDRHFVGTKKFADYMRARWPQVSYVLIIGKGVEYPYMRTTNDVINNVNRVFFVPTFGFVGSDNMLFSQGNFPDPFFAIGRIAVRTPDEIKIYLEKLKKYDEALLGEQTIEKKYWMKRIMHLGGGGTVLEQNAIKNGLRNMQYVLEQSQIGAEVSTFYKTSTDILQSAKIDEIKNLINTGINMLTFFGHSAPGTWDFNVEDPTKFENFGKYPIINSLGCYSGNIHSTSQGLSERFVLTKDKGSIAFLASAGTAFIGQLSNYGYNFYRRLGNESYGRAIGAVLKDIITENKYLGYAEYAFNQQQTFHGDPSIQLYTFPAEDYTFDSNSFSIEPKAPNSSTEKIKVTFDIINLGQYKPQDSIELKFYHQLPSGKIIDTIKTYISAPSNRGTYSINVKGYGIKSLGKNTVFGFVDPNDNIKERPLPDAENNNDLGTKGYSFYIYDNSAFPVYPQEFAIVGNLDNLTLKASTNNAAIRQSKYFFEIDTTEYYNSPLLIRQTVESRGGVISFSPKLKKLPNTVYYWRVIPEGTAEFVPLWQSSSFIYLPGGGDGWNQSHYFQYQKDDYKTMAIKAPKRKFVFEEIENSVRLRNKYYEDSDKPGCIFNFVLFRSVFTAWEFMRSGIGVIVNSKNENSFWPYVNQPGGSYGAENPTGSGIDIFPFYTDNFQSRKNFIDFIENQVKSGYYISLFTIIPDPSADLKVQDWAADSIVLGKNIFSVLEKLGAKKIRNLLTTGSVPYLLQAHNGEDGVIGEEIAATKSGIIEINGILKQKGIRGTIKSTTIGPVQRWKQLDLLYGDKMPNDTAHINVIGITADNTEEILYRNVESKTDLNIDARKYPAIRLESYHADNVDKSSAQLGYWRVYFDPLPEAGMAPNLKYAFDSDTLQEGAQFAMSIAIDNINKIKMDSLLIHYTVISDQNVEQFYRKRIGPLYENTQGVIDFKYPTFGKPGQNQLVVEMNPDNDQPELYHSNNYFIKTFYVEKDKKNPLLDVFFDGVQIMDGDIVSPSPEIKIYLRDDNKYIPVTDPNSFMIQLDTGRNNIVEIPYNDSRLKFTPASNSNETATLLFYPKLKSGDYKLIVQGRDMAGNKSGINPRTVNFKVIEKQMVSNILNYPNPFSTSTQFIFTLTGNEIPDIMSISIMTLTGKVVKEITKDELGPLHIGVNRTQYKWDGTDDYGSKLANGVYLYKVNVRKSGGEKYDHYTNNKSDTYFQEGFGKMVIMR
jgi:hypothetical protein